MQATLPTFEISVYSAAWITAVFCSIYNVYLASRRYYSLLSVHDFEMGWFGGGKWRKDVSDGEWDVFSQLMLTSLPYMAIHLVGGQLMKRLNEKLLPLFYFLLGAIWMHHVVGTTGILFLTAQPLLMFAALKLSSGSSLVLYPFSIAYILISSSTSFKDAFLPETAMRERYVVSVVNAWFNARSLSFCLDHAWGEVPSGGIVKDLVKMLAHCFYLPVSILGPIINFKDFDDAISSKYRPWTEERALEFGFSLLRIAFWFLANQLIVHAFYFSALQYDYDLLSQLDLWTLCGVGYSMGQFFFQKYLVIYGMPRAFVVADGVHEVYSLPKCIGRIHLYSDMWRYFDNGLYKFIRKYFYRPFLGTNRGLAVKLLASAVTFSFVYVWHGTHGHVLLWTILNFVGVTMEALAREIGSSATYQRWETALLFLLGAPLFMMSILSNFYFFMGTEVGNLFVTRTCLSWPVATPLILVVMYCGAQTSFEAKNWEMSSVRR